MWIPNPIHTTYMISPSLPTEPYGEVHVYSIKQFPARMSSKVHNHFHTSKQQPQPVPSKSSPCPQPYLLRSILIQSHNLCPEPLSTLLQLTFSLWHSEDRASWYFLIIKANDLHYFSYLSDKVFYMFRTGPLSIIRSISTLYTRSRYVFVMLVLLESASSANCHNVLDWPLTTPATRSLLNILIHSLLDGHNQQLRPHRQKTPFCPRFPPLNRST